MAKEWQLDWKGADVQKATREAVRKGMDDTMAKGVLSAKQNHGWRNRTGNAERSINFKATADEGGKLTGYWGSFGGNNPGLVDQKAPYFLWLEIGTRYITADRTLQRAADREYKNLFDNIRKHIKD